MERLLYRETWQCKEVAMCHFLGAAVVLFWTCPVLVVTTILYLRSVYTIFPLVLFGFRDLMLQSEFHVLRVPM